MPERVLETWPEPGLERGPERQRASRARLEAERYAGPELEPCPSQSNKYCPTQHNDIDMKQ